MLSYRSFATPSSVRSSAPAAALFTLAVATAACSGADAPAATPPTDGVQVDATEIVRGVPSRGRDPAVVAIDVNGEGLCTGSLIAPDIVLTARHCVSHAANTVACPAAERQVFGERDARTLRIYVGDEVSSARLVARGDAVVVPPLPTLCGADIALVVLDRAVDGVEPLVVSDDATGVAKGDHVRAVGFGRGANGASAGNKLYREHVRVLDTSEAEFLVGEATCQGDSGGPAIDEETGLVVGVVSRGGPTCNGPNVHNVYTRVDVFPALFAEATDRAKARAAAAAPAKSDAGAKKPAAKPKKPKSDVGAACTVGSDCSSGICVTEAAGRYCSRACGNGDRCPAGYRCRASTSDAQVCIQR